jgi:presenilin enhancer 2
MDLQSPKVTQEQKLALCTKYFYFGFALLPFLWGINAVWFYSECFNKAEFPGQQKMKRMVIISGIGCMLWTSALVAWISVFAVNRADWGATADYLSFNIPIGKP